jgi:hypothetical protein
MSGRVVPKRARFSQRLGAAILAIFGRALTASLRYRWADNSGRFQGEPASPAIYCLWHNRLALALEAYGHYIRARSASRGLAAMVSASKDGAFLSALLEKFRVQPVRGSTSRRGPQALLELTTWAEQGYDLAITPDGPRGPACVVQDGVMGLAQLTGLPIVPFSYRAQWKIRLKSWDGFQIPLPFSRCEMRLDKPITVPREASDDERERLRKQLEKALIEMSAE